MASTTSIIIEVSDEGAAKAVQNINAEVAKLTPNLQQVTRVSEQTFNNIEGGALKARESAALLGEEFGIKIPRALRGTIAQSALVGPAFSAAFSGLAVIGFVEIAIRAVEQTAKFIDKLGGWSAAAKQTAQSQKTLNEIIAAGAIETDKLEEAYRKIGLTGLALIKVDQQIANEKFDAAKTSVGSLKAQQEILQQISQQTETVVRMTGTSAVTMVQPTKDAIAALATLAGAAATKTTPAVESMAVQIQRAETALANLGLSKENADKDFSSTALKDAAADAKKLADATEAARVKLDEMTTAAVKSGLAGIDLINADELAALAKAEEISSRYPALVGQAEEAEAVIRAEASRKRIALWTDEADKKFKLMDEEQLKEEAAAQELLRKQRTMEDQTASIEKAAAVATAPPWERANAAITASYEERMDKIKAAIASGQRDEQHATREQTAALQILYAERANLLASQMQSLFDAITTGNIGQYFLKKFEQMVFQMVAEWIVGMQKMQSASQGAFGGGGGILSSIFGALGLGGLSGGGGGGQGGIGNIPGVITNFGGGGDFGGETGAAFGGSGETGSESSGGLLGSLGLSAGVGAGAPGMTLPAGAVGGMAAGATGGGLIAGLLGQFGKMDAGSQLATMAGLALVGGTWGKGGWLAGLGGAAGGALTGFEIGGMLGPLGAFIGAGIGAIVGFLGGFFQHSTKKARLAIEADIKAKSQAIEDAYNIFTSDAPTSLAALEVLRTSGIDALKKAGVKDISRSRVGHVDQWIDKAEREINATQAQRDIRTAMVFGPAEFRTGGFVGPSLGGSVPAWFAASAMRFAAGGAVPAFLHENEFVMRSEAVARIGARKLADMNAGSGGGEAHYHFHINAIDAKSFDEFLSNGGMARIMRAHRRGISEGAW